MACGDRDPGIPGHCCRSPLRGAISVRSEGTVDQAALTSAHPSPFGNSSPAGGDRDLLRVTRRIPHSREQEFTLFPIHPGAVLAAVNPPDFDYPIRLTKSETFLETFFFP